MRIYLKARILPAFGRMPLDRIGREDVAAWFDAASRDKPGAANPAFEILRAMMFRAEEWGLRGRGANPCLGIAKNPRNHVARFLDVDELARLGRALDTREPEWPEAVAAIRLLALTGCRRSEVLNLRWRDIGADAINLRDSKTGPRAVPLGEAARAHIATLPGARDPDTFLFPSYAHGKGYYSFRECWRTVCEDASFSSLRLHDLRHTATSQAVMSGENLPLVGKLLGHKQPPVYRCLCTSRRRASRRDGGEDREHYIQYNEPTQNVKRHKSNRKKCIATRPIPSLTTMLRRSQYGSN